MADPTVSYERWIEAAGIALASGDHSNAERALRAAIQATEGLEDSYLERATALIKLGTLKLEMANHAEAEGFFRNALEINERVLGSDNLGLVPALKGLGTTRVLRGTPQDAEPLLARALAISERHLGGDHPDLVILLNDLTRLYLKQSAHAFAEPLLLRLLEMKRSKGEDHPEVATVLASLAAVRQALGLHEAAEQLWRRVLSIRERTLAPNHFAIATAVEHLAETCSARGKVREALQLFQRALTIRESTLGRDHASLRSSRERIADLELQASEESFDSGDSHPAPAEPARRLTDEELGLTIAVGTGREKSVVAPMREVPIPMERPASPSHSLARIARPPMAEVIAAPAKPLAPEAYFDALQSIQDDLNESDAGTAQGSRAMALFSSIGAFLQTRRRAAAIVGVGVLTVPIAAWAVIGAVRTDQPRFVTSSLAADPLPRKDPVLLAGAPSTDPSKALTSEASKDSANGASGKSAASARGGSAARTDTKDESESIRMPTAPSVTVRLDSMRVGASVPIGGGETSMLRHLASAADLRTGTATASVAPVRARMIGALPTPRYPGQQLRGRTGGEVRVRFDVDTLGRPVMSTFTVVGSPLPQLAAAVKDVIPSIRFEPARTPWPESRKLVETVELAFQFALPAGK